MPTQPSAMDPDLAVYYAIGLVVVPIVVFLLGYLYVRRRFKRFSIRLGQEMSGNPGTKLSRTCPKCGSAEYSRSRQMRGQFLINCDRICRECKTLYTSPTPTWISVSFILSGIACLAITGALTAYVRLTYPESPGAIPIVWVLGSLLACLFLISGIMKLVSARGVADLPVRPTPDS